VSHSWAATGADHAEGRCWLNLGFRWERTRREGGEVVAPAFAAAGYFAVSCCVRPGSGTAVPQKESLELACHGWVGSLVIG
jgi:hypothetical protein